MFLAPVQLSKDVREAYGVEECGGDTVRQRQDLDMRPQVGIATPGRFTDNIDNNSTFSKSRVRNLVLDKEGRLLEGNTTLL